VRGKGGGGDSRGGGRGTNNVSGGKMLRAKKKKTIWGKRKRGFTGTPLQSKRRANQKIPRRGGRGGVKV